ncbi:MAG TPA: hypothetical protein VE377_13385 [Candidatus Dormibacteraeota bacterium]|nr:hypothetical protein [Candidatus Dormibacteraeota bacterium]
MKRHLVRAFPSRVRANLIATKSDLEEHLLVCVSVARARQSLEK